MKKDIFFKLLIIMFILLPFSKGELVRAGNNYIDVLIIEDEQESYGITENIKNILGFYNKKGRYINSTQYVPKEVYNYDEIIIISENSDIKNSDLILDLEDFTGKIFWIGSGVEQILDKEIYNDKDEHGIVWHINNVWNMVIIPNESESFFILSEAFNYFFEKENIEEFQMFLKITDIDMVSDPEKLKKIADYLYEENIPFIIVINEMESIILNKGEISEVNYYKVKEFFKIVNYMENKGGSVIIKNNLNIYAQVNDIIRKDYLKDENVRYINLQNFIEECVKNQIYPLGVELSNSEEDRDVFENLKEMFTTFTYSFDSSLNLKYPFIIKDYNSTYNIITENIGLIDGNNKNWLEDIEYNIKKLRQVRGSTGAISFSSTLDIEYLRELIKATKKMEGSYTSLKSMNNKVTFNDRLKIESLNGSISYSVNSNHDEEYLLEEDAYIEKSFFQSTFSNVLIIAIGVFTLLFTIIYYYCNNHNNKNIN